MSYSPAYVGTEREPSPDLFVFAAKSGRTSRYGAYLRPGERPHSIHMYRFDTSWRSNRPKYRSEASERHIPGYHDLLGEAWDATAPAY